MWEETKLDIFFYLHCFFCRALWAVANGDYVEAWSAQAVVVQYLFWKPKIQKILVRWFWKFWREQFFISCDTQSLFPHNFSNCSSPKIICFNNWQQCQFFNILRIHLSMCKFVLFCKTAKTGLVLVYDDSLIGSWVTDPLAMVL